MAHSRAARSAALVIEAKDLAVLGVTGKDRLTWLNGLVTCDLAKSAPGDAVYGLAVAKNGKILADLVAVIDVSRVLLAVPSQAAEALKASLEHYLIMEDAEIAPTEATAWLVHGPRATDVLAAARDAGAVGGALDLTGAGGAIAIAQKDTATAARTMIAAAIAQAGGSFGDAADWDALRLEAGVPAFGADFDATTYPQEAGLETTAVSFNKGCYLGQEVVCMLEMRGHVKRKLVPLVFDGGEPPARGAVVSDETGAEIGHVTSAAKSPSLGKPIALAMVKRAFAEAGVVVSVGGVRAKVALRPVER
jgi:folate-binding protein YgfZ